jgi:hypothetical protein
MISYRYIIVYKPIPGLFFAEEATMINPIIQHAISNFDNQNDATRFISNGILPKYWAWELDEELHLYWLFFTNTKSFYLNKEKLKLLASMISKKEVEIHTMPSSVEFREYSEEEELSVEIYVNASTSLVFLEAFTNACKYGERIWISNHMTVPYITITNSISKNIELKHHSSKFGLSSFRNFIKKGFETDDIVTYYAINTGELA